MKNIYYGVLAVCGVAAFVYENGLLDFRRRKTPDESKVRVACVGDSITYGNQTFPRDRASYPSRLQKLLGDDYQVDNFGLNSRTALDSGDKPYSQESEYKRSLAFRPNIVVFKFGTNDAKTFNWETQEDFEADYKALVESYEALDTKPVIYLCVPAAAYDSILGKGDVLAYKITQSGLAEAREVVRKVAVEKDLPLIDVYEFTKDHRDWFVWDGIHPNAKSTAKLAEYIFEAIK